MISNRSNVICISCFSDQRQLKLRWLSGRAVLNQDTTGVAKVGFHIFLSCSTWNVTGTWAGCSFTEILAYHRAWKLSAISHKIRNARPFFPELVLHPAHNHLAQYSTAFPCIFPWAQIIAHILPGFHLVCVSPPKKGAAPTPVPHLSSSFSTGMISSRESSPEKDSKG